MNLVPSGANVALPMAVLGRTLYIANDGAAAITVNAQPGNTVNGGSNLAQTANSLYQYVCFKPGQWVGFGTGGAGTEEASAAEPAAERSGRRAR
jgi:hypothetical protein